MNQIHPKAAEAQARAEENRAHRAQQKAALKDLRERGIRFLHVGTVTVAYRVDRHNVIHAANTLRHPNDKHDALFAKLLAGNRLVGGMHVTLRRPPNDFLFRGVTTRDFIAQTFAPSSRR